MKKRYYLTTPLYYVNAKPHIGHSYTTIAADVLARFKRLMGYEVMFLTGTDEHGQKVQKAGMDAGLTPQAFTDKLSAEFHDLWKILGISFDDFIRTTEKRHTDAVQHIWRELHQKGHIVQEQYEGWYCTPCEAFWPYREIGHDTENKSCPQCNRSLEAIREDNYFFTLSKFQDWLIGHIQKNANFIQPESRRNETLSFLQNNKLLDLCISRPKSRLEWGIACPLSSNHVTYVWFDALINYISALGYPETTGPFAKFWPCDAHLIGKDILRPHTVYWPIMLHALGLEPPKRVFAHGWWMQDKAKMSKSIGNIVNPYDVVKEFSCDAYRYFLMREIAFGLDGSYSYDSITLRYNTDLANDLGNLVHRTLSMMEKYYDGCFDSLPAKDADNILAESVKGLALRMENRLNNLEFQDALTDIWGIVNHANKFIEDSAPWRLHKEKKTDDLKRVMGSLCETLRIVAQAIWPFMPETSEGLWKQLGLDTSDLVSESFRNVEWNYFEKGIAIRKGKPLFPRRET